jgi:hypothetical protein
MDSNVIFPELPTYVGTPSLGGLLSLLVSVVLPIVAAWFMRSSWTAMQKGLVLLTLAAVKAFAEAWIGAIADDMVFNWATTLYSVVVQFILGVVAYVGLWKGTHTQQQALHGGPVNDRKTINGSTV